MRAGTLVAFGIAFAGASLGSATARAQQGYHHGRLRYVEPGVTVQRSGDDGAEEADVNEPFLPGDRVFTDASGRAELQFTDGSVVRLDRRSSLDYAGHEEDREERVVLRPASGSLMTRVRPRSEARYEIETPGGSVFPFEGSVVRIDVDAGEARISVYDGEAAFDDGRGRVQLATGERTYARSGSRAEEPERFDPYQQDDFARWDADREANERWASGSSRYLPTELATYSDEFDRYGDWRYEDTAGYVWVPQVEAGWRPYSNGRWDWTPYGWTWVPYEPWGWAPCHYGRWGYSAAFGWYWCPGRTWGPAWVSWGVGGGYVGWCPLGRHDRPVTGWVGYGGHAVARGRFGREPDAWSIVRQGQLGRRDVARLRVSPDRIDPAAIRIADTARLRPTRDGSRLLESNAVPRAIRMRPTPGNLARQRAVDNQATSRAPWFRRPTDTRTDTDRTGAVARGGAAERRPWSEARPVPSQGRGDASGTGATRGRPVPWFRAPENGPRSNSERDGAFGRGGASDRGAPARGGAAERRPWWSGGSSQPRSREEAANPARRRDDTAWRSPAWMGDHARREAAPPPAYRPQPRNDSERRSGGAGYRSPARDQSRFAPPPVYRGQPDGGWPRPGGRSGGEARPRGGGHSAADARPSGGGHPAPPPPPRTPPRSESRPSGGGSSAEHAAPRPHRR